MLLAIDVGNTNTVIGKFEENKLIYTNRMITYKNDSDFKKELDKFFSLNNYDDIHGIVISSVVPEIMPALESFIMERFKKSPFVINSFIKSDIKIIMDNPSELGPDRLVNCAAATELYGSPVIVIDYGTANTYDYVNENNEFITGITTLGIKSRLNAIASSGSMLWQPKFQIFDSIIANTTESSLLAGSLFGVIGETEYIVNKIKAEFGGNIKVIGTGGLSSILSEKTNVFDELNPNLTMEGLRILYEYNN